MSWNETFEQKVKQPLDRYLAGTIAETDYDWYSVKYAVRSARKEHFHEVRNELLPYYHKFMMADLGFFRNGCKDTHVKNQLLEIIEGEGKYAGRLFNDLDLVKAAENWAERLMPDNHDPGYFFKLMKAILKRDYKTDWNQVYKYLRSKLSKSNKYGNFKTHEMYCLLMGITMIELSDSSREKKDELLGLMYYYWSFIKYMYSVLIGYIIGLRLDNFAAVANSVCVMKSSHHFMNWFYKAFNEKFDVLCPEGVIDHRTGKSIRALALEHKAKMEDIIKSNIPSNQLDELFGILFPKVIDDLNRQARPKTYDELEKAVDDLTTRYNNVLKQLTDAVKDLESERISIDDLTAAFLRLSYPLAMTFYGNVSTLLAYNPTWKKYSEHILKQIEANREKPNYNVAGDIVINKYVEHAVEHVGAGGTGINIDK